MEGGGGWGGVGNFQCRSINPVILFYSIDCSTRLHVSSCTNRTGLKQPVITVWMKPKASQAHVSRKRKQFIYEGVTRCVTRYMGNRDNSDCKTSLREVVSNFRESGDRSKNSTFFYLLQKTLLVNRFQK